MTPLSNRVSPLVGDFCLQPYLSIRLEKCEAVDRSLLPRLLAGERRKRRRRPRDAENISRLVRMVLANALKAHAICRSHRVYFSRMASSYSNDLKGIYYPNFVGSKSLLNLIGVMTRGGWLEAETGQWNARKGQGTRSTFTATEKLLVACAELGISHETTRLLPSVPVLILRDGQKKRIPYRPRDKRDLIASLRAFNRFLSQQSLALNVTDSEWRQLIAEVGGRNGSPAVDMAAVSLHRVFNNSDWEQGGRFYGGWWQRIPSKWRGRITINSMPTVELDYSGFIARAMYHAENQDYSGDPYEVPTIRELLSDEATWPIARDGVKLALHGLLNAKRQHDLSKMKGLSFPDGISNGLALGLIQKHHAPIADKFRDGQGLRIMFRESRVCQSILKAGLEQDIPVLPIHDSFIVQERQREWLYTQMVSSYRTEFGRDPVIRESDKRDACSESNTNYGRVSSCPFPSSPQTHPSYVETVRPGREGSACAEADTTTDVPSSIGLSDSGKASQADARFLAMLESLRKRAAQ